MKDQTLWQIICRNCEEKNPQNRHYLSFPFKKAIKIFFQQISSGNDISHPLKKVYNSMSINLSKVWNSSFLDYSCHSSFKFLSEVLSISKTTNFNHLENIYHDMHLASKQDWKLASKIANILKKGYTEPLIWKVVFIHIWVRCCIYRITFIFKPIPNIRGIFICSNIFKKLFSMGILIFETVL